ncbi:hypothetical protein [Dyadobacter sp. Leaf189]|uniref:hypothetical protein n=1 Tax=Dyadobacter sp. Leaf189 TaxID=1736295 RepID=UPI0006FBB28C|nr:hypothetical protein [Dyadobacter sp. Leaf189]KQS30852.1 hypothetical protein ASG33_10780 [Dyadobacter sp. Leaf189]
MVYNAAENSFETNPGIIQYPATLKPTSLQSDAAGNILIRSKSGLGVFSAKMKRYYSAGDVSEFQATLQKVADI